jgi:nitroimidazol reductase NimA-like FMN-containing flavoprotein (pyridoxamine 5'-phosphate oxidase superfamily)
VVKDDAQRRGEVPPSAEGIADRVAVRREQLGLGADELAVRACMAPLYLRYLLTVGPGFDDEALQRLAGVLDVPYGDLVEGPAEPSPGQGSAGDQPVLGRLTAPECWELLGTHGIGRVALAVGPSPLVLPVNYLVDGNSVVYRTDPAAVTAAEPGSAVSFQADHADESEKSGWSVLITGSVEHLSSAAEIQRLAERPGSEPWAGGVRNLWVRITPTGITGRRITVR